MKIQIRRIGMEGMKLEETYPVDMIGLAQEEILKFVLPFEVRAQATRAEDEVVVEITSRSVYESFCSRCLEPVRKDWTARFVLSYDTKEYKEFIELDEEIRQEMILNLPLRILCDIDCKGLCVDCGTNLNKTECKHKHVVTGVEQK